MTREEINKLWNQALSQAVQEGEQFTRYHFAELILEAAAVECESMHPEDGPHAYAYAIRAMKPGKEQG